MRPTCRFSSYALAWLLALLPHGRLAAQAEVSPVFATPDFSGRNMDSTAVWVPPPPGEPLLFVTEKDGDHIQVWNASTGKAYAARPSLGGEEDGSGPGDFNRPNGVWVVYHVPHPTGFNDLLLVTDQENFRVQVFRLPQLDYFGEFGTGEIGKGYGLAAYQDGVEHYVFISDTSPPSDFPGKIKKYRLRPAGDRMGADLVLAFGASGGNPSLASVESMAADPVHDRLHLCGDEGGSQNRIFRLDGTYTGTVYGGPQFEHDQEGINVYDSGGGRGYIVVSDQYRDGDPNQYELFDRVTLAPLGNFHSPAGGPLVTSNTDGAYLEQRPLPGFPNGAFYPVHNDRTVHVYDWTDVAEAMDLELVALDRPFAVGSPAGQTPPGARAVLWFHDGSWWGALPRAGELALLRLEDGAFAHQETLGPSEAAAARAAGEEVALLLSGTPARALRLGYEPSRRRYRIQGAAVAIEAARGQSLDLAVETDPQGRLARGWVAWAEDGEARVAWSDAALGAWDPAGAALGPALETSPRLLRLAGATAVVWASPEGLSFRLHRDADAPATWSPLASTPAPAALALAAAALPDGGVLAALAGAGGEGALRLRAPDGSWRALPFSGTLLDPALIVDGGRGRVHLFHSVDAAGRGLVHRREASAADLGFGPSSLAIAWPGVDHGPALFPADLPAAARDLVAASMGDDGFGRFSRTLLPGNEDRSPPITLQHSPPPGAVGVTAGTELFFRIEDDQAGVDRAALRLLLNGVQVTPRFRGVARNFLVTHPLAGLASPVRVRIEAADLAAPPRAMVAFEYEFQLAPGPAPTFIRGDANGDRRIDISDPIRALFTLFAGAGPVPCDDAADANDDGLADVSDPLTILGHLFRNEPSPPPPWPACATDPTPDALGCGRGC